MSIESNCASIVNEIIRLTSIKNSPETLLFGTVTGLEPLRIKINSNGLELYENQLFLGQMCRPHKVTIPHNHLINAMVTDDTKAINTKNVTAGIATDVPQTTGAYDVKTQKIENNKNEGTIKRTLETENKTNVDLGGAGLSLNVNVTGSTTTMGAVLTTTDLSSLTVNDNGHKHIIPEHSTQDVHFPDTNYEDSVTLEIYPKLKVNDTVLMFAFNNYQKYYVAERIESVEE